MAQGVLTREEVVALVARAQKGEGSAQEVLVERNLALVKSIVRRFLHRGVEYDDLYQIGCIGLVKAIQNYDAKYNVQFSTYAVPLISGEIKRFLRDDGMIKVSRNLKELLQKALAAQKQLTATLGQTPTVEEIAKYLNVSASDILMATEAGRSHVSLHQRVYDEEDSPLVIDCVQASLVEPELPGQWLDAIWLGELLKKLPERERTLLRMRYWEGKTQSEIAAHLQVSQVQVSRMEKRILTQLRGME